ncbi:MAG: putative signal transducing protein [Planctomycetota bacterium]
MKKVYIAQDPPDAHFVAGILREHGITCEVLGEELWGARGALSVSPDTLPAVWIQDDGRYEQALNLIRQIENKKLNPPSGGSPWKCPNCDENMEAQYTDCWKCGTPRPEETMT